MVKKLNQNDPVQAEEIYSVFQASYAVEAKLLNAEYFPPLHRKVDDFSKSQNAFFGFFEKDQLVSVTEILEGEDTIHIQSLVVHPNYFRRSIGSKLINYIFELYQSNEYTVETGVDNQPAIKLYLKLGFEEVKQWDTEIGIRKIAFRKVSL